VCICAREVRVVSAKVVKIRVWVCSVSCRSGGSAINFKDVIDLQCFVRINWTNPSGEHSVYYLTHNAPRAGGVRRSFDSANLVDTIAYGARPVLISRASRSAVALFSQLDADRKVTT